GEAAAIAAGLSPFGLGSDSGGSLRQPAHFCGLACLKPTAWLVPLTGMVDDEGDLGAIADPRTQIGPMARFVEDVELLLSVVGCAATRSIASFVAGTRTGATCSPSSSRTTSSSARWRRCTRSSTRRASAATV